MVNRVVLVGRLSKDPELRRSTSGVAVTSLTVAVDDRFSKDQAGKTSFLPVVCFQKTAEFVAEYARKGALVSVDGRIQQRSYENKDNQKVYVIEILADSVQLLEPKSVSEARINQQQAPQSNYGYNNYGGNYGNNYNQGNNPQPSYQHNNYQPERQVVNPFNPAPQSPIVSDALVSEDKPNFDISDDDLPF